MRNMVLLRAVYLGLSRRMWQKCTGINANFKATFDISIGEVNESRLNVRFGVIIRKVTSLLTLILVASVKNTKYHVALINVEDGMEGLERKSLPEGLCDYGISGVTPRLEPDGKDRKDREGKENGQELQQRVPCTRPRPRTLTSPSLPSQGSLVLMAGNAPPPTGAVDPRPKESSLGDKRETSTHITRTAGADGVTPWERMTRPLHLCRAVSHGLLWENTSWTESSFQSGTTQLGRKFLRPRHRIKTVANNKQQTDFAKIQINYVKKTSCRMVL